MVTWSPLGAWLVEELERRNAAMAAGPRSLSDMARALDVRSQSLRRYLVAEGGLAPRDSGDAKVTREKIADALGVGPDVLPR